MNEYFVNGISYKVVRCCPYGYSMCSGTYISGKNYQFDTLHCFDTSNLGWFEYIFGIKGWDKELATFTPDGNISPRSLEARRLARPFADFFGLKMVASQNSRCSSDRTASIQNRFAFEINEYDISPVD